MATRLILVQLFLVRVQVPQQVRTPAMAGVSSFRGRFPGPPALPPPARDNRVRPVLVGGAGAGRRGRAGAESGALGGLRKASHSRGNWAPCPRPRVASRPLPPPLRLHARRCEPRTGRWRRQHQGRGAPRGRHAANPSVCRLPSPPPPPPPSPHLRLVPHRVQPALEHAVRQGAPVPRGAGPAPLEVGARSPRVERRRAAHRALGAVGPGALHPGVRPVLVALPDFAGKEETGGGTGGGGGTGVGACVPIF